MSVINFKLCDREKHDAIWTLLNSEYYTEENDWCVRYSIQDVYDDYAICYDYEGRTYVKVYYIKDDESDSLSLSKKENCKCVYVNDEEYDALQKLQAQNENTFAAIDVTFTKLTDDVNALTENVNTLTAENETYSATVASKDEEIAQLNASHAEFTQQMADKVDALDTELNTLKQFKANYDLAEKEKVINKYSLKLSEEAIKKYSESLENYTAESLEKELSFELVKASPEIFSLTPEPEALIPTQNSIPTGIEELLNKYKK